MVGYTSLHGSTFSCFRYNRDDRKCDKADFVFVFVCLCFYVLLHLLLVKQYGSRLMKN